MFAEKLGTTSTDKNGNFMLSYHTRDFYDLMDIKPDPYVRVLDKAGKLLYTSENAIRFEASCAEVFKIKI